MYAVIKGGLGNQMFQAAFAKSLASEHGGHVTFLDMTAVSGTRREWALNCFGLSPHAASRCLRWPMLLLEKIARHLCSSAIRRQLGVLIEGTNQYNISDTRPPLFISGYWQGYKYIKHQESHVRHMFVFPSTNWEESEVIRSDSKRVVGLHVRCGDYISNSKTAAHHRVCSPEWYGRAWSCMRERHKDIRLLVVSDDPEWAKANLRLSGRVDFVPKDERRPAWADMQILSQCDHFILSNSSFSWWAAFLGAQDDSTVYVPSEWYPGVSTLQADMLLPKWDLISVELN